MSPEDAVEAWHEAVKVFYYDYDDMGRSLKPAGDALARKVEELWGRYSIEVRSKHRAFERAEKAMAERDAAIAERDALRDSPPNVLQHRLRAENARYREALEGIAAEAIATQHMVIFGIARAALNQENPE